MGTGVLGDNVHNNLVAYLGTLTDAQKRAFTDALLKSLLETEFDAVEDWISNSQGAWDTTWIPSWTNLTIGAGGINTGAYKVVGKICYFRTYFKYGAGSAVGAAILTLPVAISAGYTIAGIYGGAFIAGVNLYDDSTHYPFRAIILPNGKLMSGDPSIPIGASTPFTWTTPDAIVSHGFYEVA